jgi:hypothetical protein
MSVYKGEWHRNTTLASLLARSSVVEQLAVNQWVAGSNPAESAIYIMGEMPTNNTHLAIVNLKDLLPPRLGTRTLSTTPSLYILLWSVSSVG